MAIYPMPPPIFWRGATRVGASAGLVTGFALWAFTIFLPSVGAGSAFWDNTLQHGVLGWGILRPQALFGITGLDPVVHSVFWSMLLNTAAFIVGSLASSPTPLERLQGTRFSNLFDRPTSVHGWARGTADAEDLLTMSQHILGTATAQNMFKSAALAQGKDGYLPDATPDFLAAVERALSGSVGAATAHAMIGQMVGGAPVSVQDMMAAADEAAHIMEYSQQLEEKSQELTNTAHRLRDANAKLVQISEQKDAFLSQISHELRTPMTSIRSFAEILQGAELDKETRTKYAGIIHDETQRLTRLLDDLLDLSVLENGSVILDIATQPLAKTLDQACVAVGAADLQIMRKGDGRRITITTDHGRLAQVFINVISNAAKYCDAPKKQLAIHISQSDGQAVIDFIDNGSGVPPADQDLIFEKFSRTSDAAKAGGAGLGLAISREVLTNLHGSITYLPGQGGAGFRVVVPISFG